MVVIGPDLGVAASILGLVASARTLVDRFTLLKKAYDTDAGARPLVSCGVSSGRPYRR